MVRISKQVPVKSQELHNEGAILIGKMQNQLADLAILDTVPLNVVKSIVHYREQTTRTRFVNLQIKTFLPAQNKTQKSKNIFDYFLKKKKKFKLT